MIYLLFTVLFAQMMLILLLLFETPFRKPLVVGLDELKRGRAQLVVKSVGATVFVVMTYNIYSVLEIRSRSVDAVNSPNHVILAYHMLEASLMGFSLFLLLMINNLQQYIRKVFILTKVIKDERKQNRAYEESKRKSAEEAKFIRNEIYKLKTEITKLKYECNTKEQQVESKKSHSVDVKNQLEGFIVEYDRLLAHNKDLRDQLQDIKDLSSSSDKKTAFFNWDLWGL